MLTQARDRAGVLAALAGDRVRAFTLRNFATPGEEEHLPLMLVDDLAAPNVVMVHRGANFMALGAIERLIGAMADLREGRVEQDGGWPDEETQVDWERDKRRYLFINSSPYMVWRAALVGGFEPHPDSRGGAVAYIWHIHGEPRFSHLVAHSCRLGDGAELLDEMRQGIGYDPEGDYVRLCLEHGPSFVCEVEGRKVCWSCTHSNGTMGMIYTPEEHRRHGYARSLAAFQIDYMLKRDGLACAHVIDHNVASMTLMRGFGAKRLQEPVVWRAVYWPGEAPPPEEH
jgi:hypothetical protein